jgi:hypothetical protein
VVVLAGVALQLVQAKTKPEGTVSAPQLPLSALIDSKKATEIVIADATLVVLRELSSGNIGLHEYMTRQYPPVADAINRDLFKHLRGRDYTDSNEVCLADKFLRQYNRFSQGIFVNSAREVDLPRLKERNVILLGSPASNPWAELYYDNLPFRFDAAHGVVLNREPGPGEQARYYSATRSGETGDTSALVAFVPNLGDNGYALLLAGTTAEATAAAGDFVLDETQISRTYKMMGLARTGSPRYFELLLKARTFPGSATQTTVQAWRLLDFKN